MAGSVAGTVVCYLLGVSLVTIKSHNLNMPANYGAYTADINLHWPLIVLLLIALFGLLLLILPIFRSGISRDV